MLESILGIILPVLSLAIIFKPVKIGADSWTINIAEIDDLRWKLHFDTVKVYIKSRRWYLLIKGKCMYLSDDNLCKIYDRRPEVCREHKSDSCEMTGQWYDKIISSPEELDAYTKQKRKK